MKEPGQFPYKPEAFSRRFRLLTGSLFRWMRTLVESHQFRSVKVASRRLHPQTEPRQECRQRQVKGMTCEMKDEP